MILQIKDGKQIVLWNLFETLHEIKCLLSSLEKFQNEQIQVKPFFVFILGRRSLVDLIVLPYKDRMTYFF